VDHLLEEFGVDRDAVPDETLAADWNVAPTKPVYAVLTRSQKNTPGTAAVRRLDILRWGLVPFWATDPKVGARMINARVETAADKPAFREAFAKRRCLLPADGYYEWYSPVNGTKQPFFIRPKDGATLAMAGLYEFWRDRSAPPDDSSAWLRTCTILTTSATDALGRIHDRQPMFVEPAAWASWLDPDRHGGDLVDLLVASPGTGLEAYPVSTAVNNHRNNGPELAAPLLPEPAQTLF
jgi:putative SOS response-associated peptidase YedK